MTLKIDDSVKQQAIKLRAEGHSYASILNALSEYGVTEWWVKSVTKGVKKGKTPTQQAIEAIYPLAIRPCGIKQAECHEIFYDVFGSVWDEAQGKWTMNLSQSSKSYIRSEVKKMAEKNGKQAVFVPDWMSTEAPLESLNLMNELAHHIQETIQECVSRYMEVYGDCPASVVQNEMLSLALPGYSPEPLERHCRRNLEVANQLMQLAKKRAQNEAQSVTEVLTNVEGSSAS